MRASIYYFVHGIACIDCAQLEEVQANLASVEQLSGPNLTVFVRLLEAVANRFPDEDFRSWKVPDGNGVLHPFSDMTVGNHEEQSQDAITKSLHFLHPGISRITIKQLRFPTVQERFLDKRVGPEFIQDFEQGQKLTTMISDVLQRYPIQDTFNEYLANAEDSGGAHKISWVVDATSNYPKDNLISSELSECTASALLCHNDGVFTQKDLESLTNIGNASKRDEPSKIGRFGRGSLTMYHWTCTPSFISGEHFVIFDPEQTRLPHNTTTRERRKGMLLSIKDVRQLWPDQLRPFEGLFGFSAQTDKYEGTLFRFPIMESRARSMMYSSVPGGITVDGVRKALTDYGQDARTALLFLKNIQSIECYERNASGELEKLWDVSVKRLGSGLTKVQVQHERFGVLTISGKTSIQRISGSDTWVLITSTMAADRIPDHLRATRERHKLQARCGIAAMVRDRESTLKGRLFLDVPTANALDIPVHISAVRTP
jgi:sacsin